MFKKSDKEKPLDLSKQEISTLIGEGYHIKGEISGNTVIRIDGKITGNVNVEAGIILGETGVIEGDVNSHSAIIYGTVMGNIFSQQLEIKKSGVVHGDIQTDTLEIELGARFTGKLNMTQPKGSEAVQKEEIKDKKEKNIQLQEAG